MSRAALTFALGLALLASSSAAALAAPGDFDASFDGDGIVALDPGGTDRAHGIVVQPDGRIVMAGRSDSEWAVARLNPDGEPDTGFSFDGVAFFTLDGQASANAVTRQPDGKVVSAGVATSVGASSGVVAGPTPTGRPTTPSPPAGSRRSTMVAPPTWSPTCWSSPTGGSSS